MMTRKLKAEKEKTGFMRNDHCGIVHQVEPRLCDLERHDGPSFPVGPFRDSVSDISTSLHQRLRRSDQASPAMPRRLRQEGVGCGPAPAEMQTVSGLNVTELKLDRLIDDMRFLRLQMIECNRRLQEIETYLKPSELDEGRPASKWRKTMRYLTTITLALMFMTVGAQADLITNGNFSGGNTAVCSGGEAAAVCPGWTVTLGNGPDIDFNSSDRVQGHYYSSQHRICHLRWDPDDRRRNFPGDTNYRWADVSSQLSTRHQQSRRRDRRPGPRAGFQCDPRGRQYLS